MSHSPIPNVLKIHLLIIVRMRLIKALLQIFFPWLATLIGARRSQYYGDKLCVSCVDLSISLIYKYHTSVASAHTYMYVELKKRSGPQIPLFWYTHDGLWWTSSSYDSVVIACTLHKTIVLLTNIIGGRTVWVNTCWNNSAFTKQNCCNKRCKADVINYQKCMYYFLGKTMWHKNYVHVICILHYRYCSLFQPNFSIVLNKVHQPVDFSAG